MTAISGVSSIAAWVEVHCSHCETVGRGALGGWMGPPCYFGGMMPI